MTGKFDPADTERGRHELEAEAEASFTVIRTETIVYGGTYTKDELIEMGCPPEVFDAEDVPAALTEATEDDFRENLEDDTEQSGDVQGNVFKWAKAL